ncbi:MAG: Ig-like domain-containing protein [Opitutae bacterium]|nr:Ig-like domain-containing protein [Opitutae bacterium]
MHRTTLLGCLALLLSGCQHVAKQTPVTTVAAPKESVVLAPVVLDTDQDGMPDDWERENKLDPTNSSDAKSDPDGDGVSNLAEYQRGTDPGDYYNGILPVTTNLHPDGELGEGGTIQVLVCDVQGKPLSNAPVIFRPKVGGHLLAASRDEQGVKVLEVRTGPDGIATAYVLPGNSDK